MLSMTADQTEHTSRHLGGAAPGALADGSRSGGRVLDRAVLVGNFASGGAWLLLLAFLGSWPLAVIGAGYVVMAGAFLAWTYARPHLTRRREAMAWAGVWLMNVVLWVAVLFPVMTQSTAGAVPEAQTAMTPGTDWVALLWVVVLVASATLVVWQVTALAVRPAYRSLHG